MSWKPNRKEKEDIVLTHWPLRDVVVIFKSSISDHRLQINTLRSRQNGRRFADDTFKRIFLNENVRISIKISLQFVPKGPINNNPALVQIMAWRRSGDKPLSKPMMLSLLTHICVTRPQWVNFVSTFCEINIRWTPWKSAYNGMSTVVQVMAWCHHLSLYIASPWCHPSFLWCHDMKRLSALTHWPLGTLYEILDM